MGRPFISHSSKDDALVAALQQTLAYHGQETWIDSRELRGGDPLWPKIRQAIDDASAFAVVVSPASLQSKWVGKELSHALVLRKERGARAFPVIPLMLDGALLGVLETMFEEEPVCIPVSSEAGGVEAAIDPILVAMGLRLPAERGAAPQPREEPLEDLVLELTDLNFHELDGARRPSARARLVYEPATLRLPKVSSERQWRFVAPLGPIEAGEVRWYLEQYASWPGDTFVPRARKIEDSLVDWGRRLHDAALPADHVAGVMQAWSSISGKADRRFSVYIDTALEAGSSEAQVQAAREAAAQLLGLPWELLHDGQAFLFQGAKAMRVRRRLPTTQRRDVPLVDAPLRVLLVAPRPEDDACPYLDHRASALPLVAAMEDLGGLVQFHVLGSPTLSGLRDELERNSYHVVHFNGHGLQDRLGGMGALCLEDPQDADKLEQRRHVAVPADELGALLRDHRIPLVFLEVFRTAQAELASESVACGLLDTGVAGVVTMSHSVLVETSRRFVGAFYGALAEGGRIGDGMLAGQRALKDDEFRGRVPGAGELRLQDWFVPVLYQEKDDPQLVRAATAPRTREDIRTALLARSGALPNEPVTGFIGRSHELLALQRLLGPQRYAVVSGQYGEGKTTLAAEFARWMVRSQQVRRAAFVSIEQHSSVASLLKALGRQLAGAGYAVAAFPDLEVATLPVERELAEQSTLLVVDDVENILPPPYLKDLGTQEPLGEARRESDAILALCHRLNAKGDTRLLFTTCDALLPPPFNSWNHRYGLRRLGREDAMNLVERVLDKETQRRSASAGVSQGAIEQLVDIVQAHASTLVLLAPLLRYASVEKAHRWMDDMVEAAEKLRQTHPDKNWFAGVERALRRLSPENRRRARVLGAFNGVADLGVLRMVAQCEETDIALLNVELIQSGLASAQPYNHLALIPALCPYLRRQLGDEERKDLAAHWCRAMFSYMEFLGQQRSNQDSQMAATATLLEVPNIIALIEQVQETETAEIQIQLASTLQHLLQTLGHRWLLKRVMHLSEAARAKFKEG